ncbi:helicase-primase complex component [Eptesicus fuscus gammaherpesvirus]|uniref:Helicase-primase complex component n=1 Tax=vespertilionid gammaherpesvirus 3 TaxID=2846598 RepID=A0A2D1A3I0_9GAMA|nr:helicase-primase complex component [Eptesicus fuscus gammaherpesvirus]ATA58270.1 helicase-primase complex component [Eptesicus fuscus gammaherpesvirus]WAH70923.1 ORF41 [Eptesicus fuscus gammaherpesvirus]
MLSKLCASVPRLRPEDVSQCQRPASCFFRIGGRVVDAGVPMCGCRGPEIAPPNASSFITTVIGIMATLTCAECAIHPTDALERTVMPALFSKRRDAGFWLLSRQWLFRREIPPPLPVDCVRPLSYLITSDGAVCWHRSLSMPVSIDYSAYLERALEYMFEAASGAYPTQAPGVWLNGEARTEPGLMLDNDCATGTREGDTATEAEEEERRERAQTMAGEMAGALFIM